MLPRWGLRLPVKPFELYELRASIANTEPMLLLVQHGGLVQSAMHDQHMSLVHTCTVGRSPTSFGPNEGWPQ